MSLFRSMCEATFRNALDKSVSEMPFERLCDFREQALDIITSDVEEENIKDKALQIVLYLDNEDMRRAGS